MEIEDKHIFHQGEDIDCVFTIMQIDGITPLPLNGVGVLVYAVIYDGYKNVKAKFKNNGFAPPWDSCTGNVKGEVSFKVLSTDTATWNPGKYYVEVKIRIPSGAYADGYYDLPVDGFAFLLKKSVTNTLTLP